MSVLVVEDDAATCELWARYLNRHGYRVRCATTLAEGMRELRPPPCCMLLDLGLPDGSGLTLLQRARDAEPPVPVAVITGSSDESVSDAVLERPSAFFTKPVDVTDILAWVRHVCPGTAPVH